MNGSVDVAAWRQIVEAKPEWRELTSALPSGDFEIAIPAPSAKARHLVLFSAGKTDLWIRFAPPRACYGVESVPELLDIAEQIVQDELCFAVVTEAGEWVSTTLVAAGAKPQADHGQMIEVVSWTGQHDRVTVNPRCRRTRG
jgi:hypothetical protein